MLLARLNPCMQVAAVVGFQRTRPKRLRLGSPAASEIVIARHRDATRRSHHGAHALVACKEDFEAVVEEREEVVRIGTHICLCEQSRLTSDGEVILQHQPNDPQAQPGAGQTGPSIPSAFHQSPRTPSACRSFPPRPRPRTRALSAPHRMGPSGA